MSYPLENIFKEVAFLAYHFHWSRETMLDVTHKERHQWVRKMLGINEKMNKSRLATRDGVGISDPRNHHPARARVASRRRGSVRSNVVGFLGAIPRARWPEEAGHGDFVDQPLASWAEFLVSDLRDLIDPVTARAVQGFFANGGARCHLIGICLASERDLMQDDPYTLTFHSLLDHLRGEENLGLLVMPVLAYLPVVVDRLGRATAEPASRPC